MPRILPLVGIAIGGVLAVNALSGARDLPGLLSGAQAFAEEAAKTVTPGKKGEGKKAKAEKTEGAKDAATATVGAATDASAMALPPASIAPKAVCAPTAAELAKQAGLSPAELQVLQSLGARHGQLDQRENDMSTQLALMAAAEAKLDAKIKALNGLKGEVNGLLNQANTKEAAEIDRLVKVFEGMKAKDAAPRLANLDDSVRIPIAAKMKERSLSAIIAQMPAAQAKELTEKLAHRYSEAQAAAAKADQVASQTAAQPKPSVDPTAPEPKKVAAAPKKKAPPRKKAPAAQQAAAQSTGGTPGKSPAETSAPPAAAPPAAAAAAPAAPAKPG